MMIVRVPNLIEQREDHRTFTRAYVFLAPKQVYGHLLLLAQDTQRRTDIVQALRPVLWVGYKASERASHMLHRLHDAAKDNAIAKFWRQLTKQSGRVLDGDS